MRISSTQTDATMMWTTAPSVDGGPIRIVVEAVPGGMWDWTAWRADDPRSYVCGVAVTAAAAVVAAAASELGLGSEAGELN